MSDPSTYTPRKWKCVNVNCSQLDIEKDAYTELVGDVLCGVCQEVCVDAGAVSPWPPP